MHIRTMKIGKVLFWLSLLAWFLLAIHANVKMTQSKNAQNTEPPFSLIYRLGDSTQRLTGFYENGRLIFCLPGCIEMEDVSCSLNSEYNIKMDGITFCDGSKLDSIKEDMEYEALLFGTNGSEENIQERISVIFMRGSRIPCIRLDTTSGNLEYIHEEKGNFENGILQIWKADGQPDKIMKVKKISGRGNTAWDAIKKSYTIKLEDASDILGMGMAKTWILNANYYDGAYIRNQIGFEIARKGGIAYVPEEQFVDLYINGEYMGLYQLMEKIEAGKNRLDIGNDYLLEIDYMERAVPEEYILLENQQPLVIHAPEKERDINKVQAFFDRFQNSIEAGNVPSQNINMESFAKMFVMEEILQDMDFGYSSHYMYLDMDAEILYDGPVWDLDNTMGRGITKEAVSLYVTDYDLPYNNISRWYAVMYEQEDFRNMVREEYKNNFRESIVGLLEIGIKEKTEMLAASVKMDEKRFCVPRSVFMPEASWEENIEYLESYLEDKLCIMDECFLEKDVQEENEEEFILPELQVQERPMEIDESAKDESAKQEAGIPATVTGFIAKNSLLFLLLGLSGTGIVLSCRNKKIGL